MKKPDATPIDRLDLMQTFVRIVEAGTLSAAAAQMGSTQPTVSRRLQALEKMLGLRLLQRSTHSMRLTKDGERCYAHAKSLLESWAAVESDLRGAKDQPRGLLRVVVPHAFGQEALIAPLAGFLQEFTEVSVDWFLHDREANLIAEGIDCAIRVGGVQDPSLVAVQLAEVPRVLVAAPGLLAPGSLATKPADLQGVPWVSLPQFHGDELEFFHQRTGRREQVRLNTRMRTDSLYAARSAAREGVGATLVSAWLVADDLATGRLRQLVPEWEAPPLPVHLVYPYARIYPARLRTFVDVMRRAMPRMVGMRPPRSA